MKIKEFLKDKTLTGVEIVDEYNVIINLIINDIPYGLNINTSEIMLGSTTTKYNNFIIENDILTCENISIDINEIDML